MLHVDEREGGAGEVVGDQADLAVARDLGVELPVEARVLERLVDVRGERVDAVDLALRALVDEHGVPEGRVQGQHLVEGRADQRDVEAGERVALAELVQPARQLSQ